MATKFVIADLTRTKRKYSETTYYSVNDWGWVFSTNSATKFETKAEAEFMLSLLKKYGRTTAYSELKNGQVPIVYEIILSA